VAGFSAISVAGVLIISGAPLLSTQLNSCKATKAMDSQKKMITKKGQKIANNSKARRQNQRKGKFLTEYEEMEKAGGMEKADRWTEEKTHHLSRGGISVAGLLEGPSRLRAPSTPNELAATDPSVIEPATWPPRSISFLVAMGVRILARCVHCFATGGYPSNG
jgi:hypothetical protein